MAISEKKVVVTKADATCTIIHGDSRIELPSFPGLADLIVTSPPYADARKKHYDSVHPDKFAEWFLTFNEAFYNTLKPTGSLVINIKDKVVKGVKHRYVWRTIDALCQHGWYSIEDYIWHKTNPMPGRWPNRLRDGWEYCFHLAKSKRPYFNPEAVRRPIGDWVASRLNVLSLALVGKNKGHPAVYPIDLPLFFIKLLCPEDGLVIDPFAGSGTTGIAALSLGRRCVLIENSAEYCKKALQRLRNEGVAQKDELENG